MLKPWVRDLGLACFSASLLILSFPEFDLSVLAWIALVPLLVALEGKSLKEAFLLSHLTGVIFFTGVFYWVWMGRGYNLIDYILLIILYLPLFVSLWGVALNRVRTRTGLSASLIAPPLWVTLEYVRSHASFLSAPWVLLGHSQYLSPPMIQIASFTGVYGLSFIIVLVNAAVAEAVVYGRRILTDSPTASDTLRFPVASVIVATCFLGATVLYGLFILSRDMDGERLRVVVLQGEVPSLQKWDPAYRKNILDYYAGLTREAAQGNPALIVWPETAVPGDVQHDPELRDRIRDLAIGAKTYLLVGSAESAKFTDRKLGNRYYNNMVLISPDGGVAGIYHKMRLVPFGEYQPLGRVFQWPSAFASTVEDSIPGDRYTLLHIGRVTFGATICWENAFSDLFREFVRRGALFMVNATDEGWFGKTAARDHFLAMSTFRAVENRVAIARSTSRGISAFIDPLGRITGSVNGDGQTLPVVGRLAGDMVLSKTNTFYTYHGDVFTFLQMAVCGMLLLRAWMKGKVYVIASGKQIKGEA